MSPRRETHGEQPPLTDLRAARRTAFLQAGLAFAVMLGTILAASLLNQRVVASIEQSRVLLIRATGQAEAVRRVLAALTDVQDGERGFLLSGDADDLAPYENGMGLLTAGLDRLDELSRGTPDLTGDLAGDVAALREGARDVAAEARRVVTVARQRGRDAAIAELRAGGGTPMPVVRARADRLLARIDEDHRARLRDVRGSEALAAWASLATAALCALLLGVTVLVLLRGRLLLLRAQSALGEVNGRLAGTIAHLRDGIAVFDAEGGLLIWNDQLVELARLPPETLRKGDRIDRILAAAWPGSPVAAPTPEGPAVGELQVGSRTLEIWRGLMPDNGQILLVADTTRRTRAESIARQAQKMEALGQLTGGVAHDFNNLLQVMSANLELIGLRAGDNPALSDRLAAALTAVDRAAQLTRHLLAFARRQPLAPEAVDTARLLGDARDMLARAVGPGIGIIFRLHSGLWPIRADPQQLESAILNLAINARDAMSGQGELVVEATNAVVRDAEAAAVPEFLPGDYVSIAIIDTGIGMSPEQLARALEPFYTTKPEGRGTGLGLPMVFGFAKQSNGHLQLSSEPGRGTTARLYLPRSDRSPESTEREVVAASPAAGELVLVVEDDASVRIAASQALHGLGYRTVEADSAAEALRRLREGLRPDVVFTDVVMPGAPDARAMVDQARRMIPRLAIVYTTGYSDAVAALQAAPEPGVVTIGKPWRTGDLSRSLREALDGAGDAGRPDAGRPDAGPPDAGGADGVAFRPGAPAPAAAPASRRLRVVLAEDDALVREMAAELLLDLGHEVVEADTGDAALRAVRAGADLLITDLDLPDCDGLWLAARANEAIPDLAVIVASGHQPDPGNCLAWLQKPYDSEALRQAIDRVVPWPLASPT